MPPLRRRDTFERGAPTRCNNIATAILITSWLPWRAPVIDETRQEGGVWLGDGLGEFESVNRLAGEAREMECRGRPKRMAGCWQNPSETLSKYPVCTTIRA